ncbi:MAG: D-alanyl-D-alanine carboxypeptidase [Candidatus Kerfeldbacteria bacterium]|nr:D-alanyl-D-alanine carboxypeptidase [Candidatus Kerfeldbacteria bacterium]
MIKAWWLIIIVTAWCWPSLTAAASQRTRVVLDQTTLERGYTLQHEAIALGIQPDSLNQPAVAWIRTRQHYTTVPTDLTLVSAVYSYTITQTTPQFLDHPVWLSYHYTDTTKRLRQFYYYDTTQQQWRALPSQHDSVSQTVRAAWFAPYSVVAVLEDPDQLLGPSRRFNFQEFGDINAAAAIVIDEQTGTVLYSHNAATTRSMASLTKLMTAYVLVQQSVDFDRIVTYHSRYDQIGARLRLVEGEQVSLRDLLYAMTVGSANNAAYALVDQAGYTIPEFVGLMNQAAAELGLNQTSFADPSGLNPANQSTAADYAKLVQQVINTTAMLQYTTTSYYSFTTRNSQVFHDFVNTNMLLRTSDLHITGSKTGYLDEALYCLALRVRQADHEIITVVLGAPTSTSRFAESERLTQWALSNYQW